jgi:hypothetical protein
MAPDEKPSRNEDEYFAREEADLMKRRRGELEAEAVKAARKQHFMKCPKCGADLNEVDMHGVRVDVCNECHGVWFDAGEIDQLKPEDKHPIRQVFGDFFAGMKRK